MSSAVSFPLAVDELIRCRTLVIGVDRVDPRQACFLAGYPMWTPPELRVVASDPSAMLLLRGTPDALRGFDPQMLPRVLTRSAWKVVAPIAHGCEAAVVGFAASHVAAIELIEPFWGLATNTITDAIFLMQGDDDE